MVAAAALELFSAHPFIFGPLVLVALLALIVKVREWRKVFHQTLVVAHRFRLIDPLIRACLCMVFTHSAWNAGDFAILLLISISLMQYGGYNLPPVVSSLIPFVGSGLSFAGGPLQYTTDAYKKVQLLLLPLSHLFYFCILPFLYFYFILFLFVRNYYWLLMHAH